MSEAKKWYGSKWITKTRRLAVYMRDGFACQRCNRDLRKASPAEVQLDHLIPRSKGGSDHECNLVMICRSCNSSRGAKGWTKFYTTEQVAHIKNLTRRKLNMKLASAIIHGKVAA